MEIHTVWAWSDWEWSDCPHCEWLPLRTLRSQKTLFEEGVFTSAHRNRRWIRWREWRRASSYLLPFPSDPVPALWDRKPAPWFFPPEKGLDTPPVFFRGGGRGGHRWAPAKLNVWGVELAHSALKRKKGGADRVFPCCNTLRSRQGCSEECVRACDLAVRSRYCWGTAAIEITGIAHGSSGWVGDGLALSPPAFPRSSALLGESLRCSSPPPPWVRARYVEQFLSKEIYIVLYPSDSHVAEATHALWSFSVHYINLSHQTVFTCLGVWLHLILKN